jgi:predicted nucleic acid-binding protein
VNTYADTSFLISLYTPDANSAEAAEAFANAPAPLLLTPFGEAEFVNTIELRVFRREIEKAQANASLQALHDDVNSGVIIHRAVPATAYERAIVLSQRHTRRLGTRGMDVLQVAIAIELGVDVFITFDLRQRRLARAVGLPVRPGR